MIVVLEGPPRPVVVRRKDRILGMWINVESTTFVNVPVSYSVATTRAPQDITDPKTYRQLSLGADRLYLQPEEKATDPVTLDEFTDALRARKKATGLYSERVGGVQFLSQNLFRATVALAPNVPVGTHKARAFLFKNGLFIKETSAPLVIVKSGFEQSIFSFAHEYSLLLRHVRRVARHDHRLARKRRLPQGLRRALDSTDDEKASGSGAARLGRTLVAGRLHSIRRAGVLALRNCA